MGTTTWRKVLSCIWLKDQFGVCRLHVFSDSSGSVWVDEMRFSFRYIRVPSTFPITHENKVSLLLMTWMSTNLWMNHRKFAVYEFFHRYILFNWCVKLNRKKKLFFTRVHTVCRTLSKTKYISCSLFNRLDYRYFRKVIKQYAWFRGMKFTFKKV